MNANIKIFENTFLSLVVSDPERNTQVQGAWQHDAGENIVT
jgi:hypothetical protein